MPQLLRPAHSTARGPQSTSPCAATPEAQVPGACVQQPEKACTEQQRPCAAKNK